MEKTGKIKAGMVKIGWLDQGHKDGDDLDD